MAWVVRMYGLREVWVKRGLAVVTIDKRSDNN